MARDLDKRLAETGEWIAGGRYSLAETAITPYFARAEYLTLLDIWIAGRPLVEAWWQRVKSRESFEIVMTRALQPADLEEMSHSGEKIRPEVAARREEYLAANAQRLT